MVISIPLAIVHADIDPSGRPAARPPSNNRYVRSLIGSVLPQWLGGGEDVYGQMTDGLGLD